MWWIFGISIWIALGVVACSLYKIDWNIIFPDSEWDFKYMYIIYILCMIIPPITIMSLIIVSVDRNKMMKIFFGYIGDWFKDNINWKW